jgi:hypothetical protein
MAFSYFLSDYEFAVCLFYLGIGFHSVYFTLYLFILLLDFSNFKSKSPVFAKGVRNRTLAGNTSVKA